VEGRRGVIQQLEEQVPLPADVDDGEGRTGCRFEHAEVEGPPETAVLVRVDRVRGAPLHGGEEDAGSSPFQAGADIPRQRFRHGRQGRLQLRRRLGHGAPYRLRAAGRPAEHRQWAEDRLHHGHLTLHGARHPRQGLELLGEGRGRRRVEGRESREVGGLAPGGFHELRLPPRQGAEARSPRLGVVRGARIQLDEVPAVGALGRQRHLGELGRGPLAAEVVPPGRDRHPVHGFAPQGRHHPFVPFARHRAASILPPSGRVCHHLLRKG